MITLDPNIEPTIVFEDVMAGRLVDVFGIFAPSLASYFFATAHQKSESIGASQHWVLGEADTFRRQRDQHFRNTRQ